MSYDFVTWIGIYLFIGSHIGSDSSRVCIKLLSKCFVCSDFSWRERLEKRQDGEFLRLHDDMYKVKISLLLSLQILEIATTHYRSSRNDGFFFYFFFSYGFLYSCNDIKSFAIRTKKSESMTGNVREMFFEFLDDHIHRCSASYYIIND